MLGELLTVSMYSPFAAFGGGIVKNIKKVSCRGMLQL